MTALRAAALAVLLPGAAFAACSEDAVELRGEWGEARFRIEIADDSQERAQGLMHRESMAASAGMLFIYERPQRVSFWMRNTLIPLDMLFITPEGRVARIHENAIPLDETSIPGGDGILYVLEINGGLSSQMGLDVGSEIRHPRIDQSIAAWPCAD